MSYEHSYSCQNAYLSDFLGLKDDVLNNQMSDEEFFDNNRQYSEFALNDSDEYTCQQKINLFEGEMTLGKRAAEELDVPEPTKVKGSVLSQSRESWVCKSVEDVEQDFNQSEIGLDCGNPESQSANICQAPQPTQPVPKTQSQAPPRISPSEKSDKTDLKMFSELTIKLLKKCGPQGLPKQDIEHHFKLELTQRALESMSDNYCLRRRLNLILTVLKCPQIGMIEECKDPHNKKIKVIKLTKKFLNDETCKMINSAVERAEAIESKKHQLFVVQQKLAKMQDIINYNKQKSLKSVRVARMTPEGVLVFEQIADSSANRVPLSAPTISAEATRLLQIDNNTMVLASPSPIQFLTVADRFLGGF